MKHRHTLALLAALAALGALGWAGLAPAEEPPIVLAPPQTAPQTAPEAAPEIELPPPGPRDDMEAGRSLVERGAELFLRGLMDEIGPDLDEMQKGLGSAAEALGPKLSQFLALIDDVRNYQAPERLPNGDIILRRSPGAPPPPPLLAPDARKAPKGDGAGGTGSIDL